MVQYRKQPVMIGSPLDSMFGNNERDTSKPSMRSSSCYKSKVRNIFLEEKTKKTKLNEI